MPYSILLVEDDALIGQGLELGLTHRDFRVRWVNSGQGALDTVQHESFDVIVLDLGLPDIDGIEVLRKLRQRECLWPVIVVTARDAIRDRIAGLDNGADDYVTKPVSTDELAARVRAVVRRNRGRASETLSAGGVVMDTLTHEVRVDGQPVELTPREYAILSLLLRHHGEVVQNHRLLEFLEHDTHESSTRAIQVHVHSLRKKIGAERIHTVRGVGYVYKH